MTEENELQPVFGQILPFPLKWVTRYQLVWNEKHQQMFIKIFGIQSENNPTEVLLIETLLPVTPHNPYDIIMK